MAKEPELDPTVTADNRVEKAREFYGQATNYDLEPRDRKSAWGQLWLLKKRAKYGWERLGFTSKEEERIKLNKPDWV